MKVFTVKDIKSEGYGQPSFMVNIEVALRTFKTMANKQDSNIGMYLDDHELIYIGDFDSKTGKIETKPHQTIVNGADCVNDKSQMTFPETTE